MFFPVGSGSYLDGATSGFQGLTGTGDKAVSLWLKLATASGIPPENVTGSLLYWGLSNAQTKTPGRSFGVELYQGKPRLWIYGAHATVSTGEPKSRRTIDDGRWHLIVINSAANSNIEDVEIFVDDFGPMDLDVFGEGTLINPIAGAPFTMAARQIEASPGHFIDRDLTIEQLTLWQEPLRKRDVAWIWNHGYASTGVRGLVSDPTSTDNGLLKEFGIPTGVSGAITMDAWYTFDNGADTDLNIYNSNNSVPTRYLDVHGAAVRVHDTPASGIFDSPVSGTGNYIVV